MEKVDFISKGRPMKNMFLYILTIAICLLVGIDDLVSKNRNTTMLVLGIFFIVCAVIISALLIYSIIVLKKCINIMVKDELFIVSPIDSLGIVELNANEIKSIDLFVLPILNGGYKETSNYNNQVKFNLEDKNYVVYCPNKKEFEEFLNKNFNDKINK